MSEEAPPPLEPEPPEPEVTEPERTQLSIIREMTAAAGPTALLGVGAMIPVIATDADVNLERIYAQTLAQHASTTVIINTLMAETTAIVRVMSKVTSYGKRRQGLERRFIWLSTHLSLLRKENDARTQALIEIKTGLGKQIGAANEAKKIPDADVTVTDDDSEIRTVTIEAPKKVPKPAKVYAPKGTKLPYKFAPSKKINPQFRDPAPTGTTG